jgi:hypothetical protein
MSDTTRGDTVATGPLGEGERGAARLAGALGTDAEHRTAAIAAALGTAPSLLTRDGTDHRVPVAAAGIGAAVGETGLAWSHAPLGVDAADDLDRATRRDDAATLRVADDGEVLVSGGVSGSQAVYVDLAPDGSRAALASRPDALIAAHVGPLEPDWDAWAQIVAVGGPLDGRTPFAAFRRLRPGERVRAASDGRITAERGHWAWLDTLGPATSDLVAVGDALEAALERLASRDRLRCLLSGGWDSRILAVLAARSCGSRRPTAWTTSSDTGTALEELVARQVAAELELDHHIVVPRADRYGDDVAGYADAVAHQSSFHVWLHPLAEALASGEGTVLDGLGGGVFLGGAFAEPDDATDPTEQRFTRLARYLDVASDIVRPEVAAQLRARTRAGFEAAVAPLADHPEARALTAYVTRTLPGISLGPYGQIAHVSRAATPFLDDEVVRAASALDADTRRDGRLYPELLRRWSPALAALPTASDRTPRRRQRPRRVTSELAATWYRDTILAGPVAELLADDLRVAPLGTWRAFLGRTRQQHLIRSLAVLALWLARHEPRLSSCAVDPLLERGS